MRNTESVDDLFSAMTQSAAYFEIDKLIFYSLSLSVLFIAERWNGHHSNTLESMHNTCIYLLCMTRTDIEYSLSVHRTIS